MVSASLHTVVYVFSQDACKKNPPLCQWHSALLVNDAGVVLSISQPSTVEGTSTTFGQFSYLCPKAPKETPIYIVQSEKLRIRAKKWNRNIFKF